MAIVLEANYSKKLGLPGYSSHQYSVTVRTEVSKLDQIDKASAQLYRQLQDAVDREISETGFLPGAENAQQATPSFQRGGVGGSQPAQSAANPDAVWNCSDKQRDLILRIGDENKIPFAELDELAHNRFNCGLKQLNKMSASGLIDELFSTYTSKPKSGYQRGGHR